MKKDLLEKLKKYSLSAGAVVAGTTAGAQVVYTDIPDDTVSGNGDSYLLDLNNDAIDDFDINVVTNFLSYTGIGFGSIKTINIFGLGSNSAMVDSSYYPYALNNGANIASGGYWSQSGNLAYFGYGNIMGSTFSYNYGNWQGATNKYLGLRITVGPDVYYGWARLSYINDTTIVIHDYAYESTPNTAIQAGDMPSLSQADPATNIVATDIDDQSNGSDMQVSFTKAANESTVSEYRIMVLNNTMASMFDLSAAQLVPSSNYTAVAPTGSNQTVVLPSTATDIIGNPITTNQPYRVFIMSVANTPTAQLDTLSAMSNQVTLVTPTPADPATGVTAIDDSDNGDGSDLLVKFTAANDESTVDQYRVIIVKEANAGTFTLADAQALPPARYKIELPLGVNTIFSDLTATSQDSDGDLIVENQPYRAFILSKADGTNATLDVLSAQSNQVTLTTPPAGVALNLAIADTTNNGNGSDLMVMFDPAVNESTVSKYRILIVKSANAAAFTLSDAEAVVAGNYTEVTPSANSVAMTLAGSAKDVDGDLIVEDVPYKAFVLSMASATSSGENSLSNVSNEATLTSPDIVDGIADGPFQNNYFFTNISSGRLAIHYRNSSWQKADVRLYDISGRLVEARTLTGEVEIFQLTAGTYIVQVQEDNSVTSNSVIVN